MNKNKLTKIIIYLLVTSFVLSIVIPILSIVAG